jgi:hypothetical protein
MEDIKPALPLEFNPVTHRHHRREVLWQVTVPIAIGAILVVVLAFLAATTTKDQVSIWADVSVISLIVPVMFVTLLSLVFLIAGIYLNLKLIHILPFYSRKVQDWFSMAAMQIGRLDNKAVEPLLRLHTLKASIGTIGRTIRRK